jgi:hypothetical protein
VKQDADNRGITAKVDGVEFNVQYDKLADLIATQNKIIKAENRRIAQKAKRNGKELPKKVLQDVVIVDADTKYLQLIKAQIDNRSEIYYKSWNDSIEDFMRKRDDEELLLMLS